MEILLFICIGLSVIDFSETQKTFVKTTDLLNFITKNSEDVDEVNSARSILKSMSLPPQQQQQQLQQQEQQEETNQNSDFSYTSPLVHTMRKKVRKEKQTHKTLAAAVKNAEVVLPTQNYELPVQTPVRLPKNIPVYINGNQKIRLAGLGANPSCQVQYVFQDETPQHEYCICPDLSYGFTCNEGFGNPCASMVEQFHVASPKLPKNYFIHCNWNVPYLKLCPQSLVWNQNLLTCAFNDGDGVESTTLAPA